MFFQVIGSNIYRPSNQNFQNLEIEFGFSQKLVVFISKQGDRSRK